MGSLTLFIVPTLVRRDILPRRSSVIYSRAQERQGDVPTRNVGTMGKPNSTLPNSRLFLCARPPLLCTNPLSLDNNLPSLDANLPLLDANLPSLDANLPSLDDGPLALCTSLPSPDDSLPLLDNGLSLLDDALALCCTTAPKISPQAALGDRPGVKPSVLPPTHQNALVSSLCACPIGKKTPPSHNPVATGPKQHRTVNQDPRKPWSR
jgi:hypothetical protein